MSKIDLWKVFFVGVFMTIAVIFIDKVESFYADRRAVCTEQGKRMAVFEPNYKLGECMPTDRP